jgi:putative heme-binding domain-containing protein
MKFNLLKTGVLSVAILCCFAAYKGISYSQSEDNPKIAKLTLQPGFTAEHLYSPSENKQGSWVSMCFDNKGRMIVSDQYGGIYRLTIPAIGSADVTPKVEPLVVKGDTVALGAAHGLLYAFNSLYVMVNNRPTDALPRGSGFYRLQDTNNDDEYDKITLLKDLEGEGEHGPHSIKLSPDGKSLYVIFGNYTKMPGLETYKLPTTWQHDNLFPAIKDPRGHANNLVAPAGWVANVDPEGKDWTLVSAGYRNPFDMTFNDIGDLFVYDADMEWDFGLPWYRPTRICHAVSGSEFGWRTGNGKWSPNYPDNLPAVINIGQGSPTNLLYLKDAKFPTRFKQSLLAFDWSFGIMHAIHLEPDGASYTAEREEFLSGIPLPLTDGAIGPDGALYFLTGGRRIESDLYRVFYTGNESIADAPQTEITPQNKLRRTLETYQKADSQEGVPLALRQLNNPDRHIQYAARLVLEHQKPELYKKEVLSSANPDLKIQGTLALVRSGETDGNALLKNLLSIQRSTLSEKQKIDLLRIMEVTIFRTGKPTGKLRNDLITYLSPDYPANHNELDRSLSKLLVHLEAPDAIRKTLDLMTKVTENKIEGGDMATSSADLILRNPQYGLDIAKMLEKVPPMQQTYLAVVLSQAKDNWTDAQREQYFKWFANAFTAYKGGNSYVGFLDKARKMALDNVPKDKRSYYDELSGGNLLSDSGNELAQEDYPQGPGGYWNVEKAMEHFKEPLAGQNFKRGKAMYQATTCNRCHGMQGEGGNIGPDLTRAGTRFGTKDLLEAIVEPSKTISDQYAATQLQLKNGESVVGRIVNEDETSYTVSQNPYAPDYTISVKKKDVASKTYSKVSLMMPGLMNSLNADEMKDLVAYIMAGGDADNKAFK